VDVCLWGWVGDGDGGVGWGRTVLGLYFRQLGRGMVFFGVGL